MSWLAPGSLILSSYLLGSVPFALLLGLSRGVDIRRVGSGNIGATNLGRALGRRWAVGAFLLDYAKGLAPVVAAQQVLFPEWDAAARGHLGLACGAAAVAGHIFPVFLVFRGGKGVATAFGAMSGLDWLSTLAAAVLWAAVYRLTRLVSLASLSAALCFPLAVWLSHLGSPFADYAALQVFAAVVALAIIIRHRSNLARLVRGKEMGFAQPSGQAPAGDSPPSEAEPRSEAGREA